MLVTAGRDLASGNNGRGNTPRTRQWVSDFEVLQQKWSTVLVL